MKLRYKLMLMIVSLMLVSCLYISQSYAVWVITRQQENVNDITTGCFSVGFTDGGPSINLDNTYPVSDTFALNNQDDYTFTVTNLCTINASYVVTLNTLLSNTLTDANIKYAIYSDDGEKPSIGSTLSTINSDKANLGISNLKESYTLATGILNGGTLDEDGETVNGGETKTYHLYLWIQEDAGNDTQGQNFEASVNVLYGATNKSSQARNSLENSVINTPIDGSEPTIFNDDDVLDDSSIIDSSSSSNDLDNGVISDDTTDDSTFSSSDETNLSDSPSIDEAISNEEIGELNDLNNE